MKKKIFLFFISAFLIFSCSGKEAAVIEEQALPVRMSPVLTREKTEEVKGFGSLSFLKKFEVLSPLEGVIETLYFREGGSFPHIPEESFVY